MKTLVLLSVLFFAGTAHAQWFGDFQRDMNRMRQESRQQEMIDLQRQQLEMQRQQEFQRQHEREVDRMRDFQRDADRDFDRMQRRLW